MSNWPSNPNWTNISIINKNNEYVGGDGIYFSDLNVIVNNIQYLRNMIMEDGLLAQMQELNLKNVNYINGSASTGVSIEYKGTISYTDLSTAQQKTIDCTYKLHMPIRSGKYISIGVNTTAKTFNIGVDDAALQKDFITINKVQSSVVPRCQNGQVNWTLCTSDNTGNTVMMRDINGNTKVNNLRVNNSISNAAGGVATTPAQIYYGVSGTDMTVAKSSTSAGTLSTTDFNRLKNYPNTRIIYDGKIYQRVNPTSAPDGTLDYVNINPIEDNNSSTGYVAYGSLFRITTSTRAWKVSGLPLKDTTLATHYIELSESVNGRTVYFTIFDNNRRSYTSNPEKLLSVMSVVQHINCSIATYSGGQTTWASGVISKNDNGSSNPRFTIWDNTGIKYVTAEQVIVEDYVN